MAIQRGKVVIKKNSTKAYTAISDVENEDARKKNPR